MTTPASDESLRKQPIRKFTRGRKESFRIHPSDIWVNPEWNERTDFTGIEELAFSMFHDGQENDVTIIFDEHGEHPVQLVDGERRHRAALLINDKFDPEWCLTCKKKDKRSSLTERLLTQLLANDGVAFTFLEKARLTRRILDSDPGLKPADIARRTHVTKQTVSDQLALVDHGAPLLIEAVASETIAAKTAIQIIRRHLGDHEAQLGIYRQALAKAQAEDRPTIKLRDIPDPDGARASARPTTQAAETPPQPESSTDHRSLITDHSNAATFTLFQIPSAPADPLEDGSFHETDRFVLEDPPSGIQTLHLLSALGADGDTPCYGYRLTAGNLIAEYLPRPDFLPGDCGPVEGFARTLQLAIEAHGDTLLPHQSGLRPGLTAALHRYFPGVGDPELEPDILPFVASFPGTSPNAPADPGALDRIKSAPSTNRDGSGVGPGNDGGFVSIDKQLPKIEALLDDLDKKDTGHESRITTTEIVLGVLRNERSISDLRTHLTGK